MDGFDLAVLGLPVAAFGVRVVTDYLGECQITTDDDDDILKLDASTSGTAVDDLVATEIHGSIVDNPDEKVPKTIQKLSNDSYENEWSCAKFLIKNIDPKCACEHRITKTIPNVSDSSSETYDTAEVSERNQVTANDDVTGVDGLSVSTETEVSEVVYEADDESEYERSVDDGSDDESITSETFFSLINCSGPGAVTNTNGNSPNKDILSSKFRPIQQEYRPTRVNPYNKDGVCDVDPTIVLEEKGVYQNTKAIDQIKRTQVNHISPETSMCDGQGRNDDCFYNNNINDRPRLKAILSDSLQKHQLDQSKQEGLQSEGRIGIHARKVNTDTANINSVSECELNEHYDSLDHSRLTINPLLSVSSGNNSEKNSLSDNRSTQLTTEYTTHNSSWVPVEPTVKDTSEVAINTPTGKQYHSEPTRSPTDRQSTPVFDHGSEMKVITDSSAVIDIPETPKSPTRQYTVACPVIEQTSPKGKRWMKRMSLEISFVDTPQLPLTSPDATDGPDSKTENNTPETVKSGAEATTSRRMGDESSTTTRRRQEHSRPHPRGRFMYQFAVPRAHIRSVIGDQARVIRRLRQRTCATISVNYPRGFDGCTCTIEGTYSQVLGAVLILRQNFPQLEWSQDEPAEQTAGT